MQSQSDDQNQKPFRETYAKAAEKTAPEPQSPVQQSPVEIEPRPVWGTDPALASRVEREDVPVRDDTLSSEEVKLKKGGRPASGGKKAWELAGVSKSTWMRRQRAKRAGE